MNERLRKTLGWVLLAGSGFRALLLALTIAVPTVARAAHETWIDHLVSLWFICLYFGFGWALVWDKLKGRTFLRLMTLVFLFLPIAVLQIASRVEQTAEIAARLPFVRIAFPLLFAGFAAAPYLLAGRILESLAARGSRLGITPSQGLWLIGMVCSSYIGYFGLLSGFEKNWAYFFVGVSYAACAVWHAWWRCRYADASTA